MSLKNKTTREHFEKYKNLKLLIGVSFRDCDSFGTKEELTELFKEDPNLNQISLHRFEAFQPFYNKRLHPVTLSECVCLIKYCLIYEIIGAEPEFVGE